VWGVESEVATGLGEGRRIGLNIGKGVITKKCGE
jgi:hypothetical protein